MKFYLSILSLLLSTTTLAKTTQLVLPENLTPPPFSKTSNIPDINTLNIQGNVNIRLIGGKTPAGQTRVSVVRKQDDHSVNVRFFQNGNTLSILANDPPIDLNRPYLAINERAERLKQVCAQQLYHHRPTVFIYLNDLNHLDFTGAGDIVGSHLQTSAPLSVFLHNCGKTVLSGSHLHLTQLHTAGSGAVTIRSIDTDTLKTDIKGTGLVHLNGLLKIQHLSLRGDGKLMLYWVKNCDLTLHATDKTQTFLAGDVGTLHIDADDHAFINARYLNADTAWIQTEDKAHVDTSASHYLFAHAVDASKIYYFEDPLKVARYPENYGTILRMVDAVYQHCPWSKPLYVTHQRQMTACIKAAFKS